MALPKGKTEAELQKIYRASYSYEDEKVTVEEADVIFEGGSAKVHRKIKREWVYSHSIAVRELDGEERGGWFTSKRAPLEVVRKTLEGRKESKAKDAERYAAEVKKCAASLEFVEREMAKCKD
jgi:hypothetical protein